MNKVKKVCNSLSCEFRHVCIISSLFDYCMKFKVDSGRPERDEDQVIGKL